MSPSELISIAIGCTCIGLGATSVGAWVLRRRTAERLLLFFGIWCVLYGIRLMATQSPVREAIGGSERSWTYLVAFITYSINIPTALLFQSLLGAGWQQSLRRVRQLQVAYAVGAISVDLVSGRPNSAMVLNNPLVLLSLAIQVSHAWWYRQRLGELFTTPVIVGGALALLVAAVNENLGRPILPAINLEPAGALVFVIALAYGVVGRVVRGEAELMAVQRELDMARDLQQSLLPRRAPGAPFVDLAAQFVPMTAVAGDLYDFVELGPTRVGVLIADVSGHGIPAALVASMIKLAFTTAAQQSGDPALALAAINRALCPQLDHGFATAVYAIFDSERRSMIVANAGHPRPLVAGRERVVEVNESGLLIGFTPDAVYTSAEIALEEGDVVLFYTDGLVEAENPAGEFYDPDRLKAWLASNCSGEVSRIGEAALAALHRWRAGRTFDDDVTLVVARYTGHADNT